MNEYTPHNITIEKLDLASFSILFAVFESIGTIYPLMIQNSGNITIAHP